MREREGGKEREEKREKEGRRKKKQGGGKLKTRKTGHPYIHGHMYMYVQLSVQPLSCLSSLHEHVHVCGCRAVILSAMQYVC